MDNTKVLTIEWPREVAPSELPNFETQARRLRYQALGKACYEVNIPSLLLGHHRGDTTETLILRLINGYRGEGLRGDFPEADIPECQGIYGAYRSGGRNLANDEEAGSGHIQDEQYSLPLGKEYRKPGFEYGGVKIYRPLLGYNKRNLQATLEAAGVPWVNDPTNIDPTLSVRNTIRHLIQYRLLPKALVTNLGTDTSALKIVAGRIRHQYLRRNAQADNLFQACDVISFDARSGCLHVRLPLPSAIAHEIRNQSKGRWIVEMEHVGARLVRHFLNIVTPQDHISLQSLEFATSAMFSNMEHEHAAYSRNRIKNSDFPSVFTACSVKCQRFHVPINNRAPDSTGNTALDPEYTWRLERQAYQTHMPKPECDFPCAQPYDTLREQDWQLWDGRYWIRLLNRSAQSIKIRPFTPRDLLRLQRKLNDQKQDQVWNTLLHALELHAKYDSRYTLPVIVDANDAVVVFPTLGLNVLVEIIGRGI